MSDFISSTEKFVSSTEKKVGTKRPKSDKITFQIPKILGITTW